MYEITQAKRLSENVKLLKIHAPHVAKNAKPGQFIILRTCPEGERIPLTIADYDSKSGEVTIIFQEIGKTTKQLGTFEKGDSLQDFAGPLGRPSEFEGVKSACVIGGGLGAAIAYPQAKALKEAGAEVDVIVGFRNKSLVMMEEEFKAYSDNLFITTDDGSFGINGFVTDCLKNLLEGGKKYDLAVVIGPLMMMKAACELTKGYNLKTIVSMNSIMVDGTSMCGCCRVTVGGEIKFACSDGPDFDGHLVDFDEAARRGAFYRENERISDERHVCRLTGEVRSNG